jgi:phage terminase large subunit-like protein
VSTPSLDFPDGFEAWPRSVQERWLSDYHALYFPKLRWWDKPETLEEDSGPRGKQLPPDHPRHTELDLQGYHCGCDIRHTEEDRGKVLDCGCGGNPAWWIHVLLTGRGFGKSKMGSNWSLEMGLSKPGIHVGVCAPTYEMVRSICFEGESGIIAEARRNNIEICDYNKNRLEIALANDSKIRGFSAEKPDSIRGENLSFCWFDELAVIRYMAFYHEGLMPALRKGENPRMLITTTPKRVRLLRELLADGENEAETGVHVTRGSSAENPHFARRQREALERKYAGTYMLKQELEGEIVGELDGCLFPLEQFNETRVFPGEDSLPQWRRVVVALDPATTARDSSDESGIVVAAEGADGDYYILEDCSGRYGPDQQMKIVAEAFYRNAADCVVGEVNMTGDYMRALLNTVDPNIPLRTVHGMKGKVARAQGPSSLFTQGRIHMVGDTFGKLEDQLSAMTENDDRSRMHDDRADAFTWAILHLSGANQGAWGMVYGFRDCTKCGGRVNEDKDQRCATCGAEVTPMVPKHAGGRPAREPWSIAYLKTCVNPDCGKKYAPRERSCPHCSRDPESFLREAVAMGAGQGGRLSYTGRDWLTGRRL